MQQSVFLVRYVKLCIKQVNENMTYKALHCLTSDMEKAETFCCTKNKISNKISINRNRTKIECELSLLCCVCGGDSEHSSPKIQRVDKDVLLTCCLVSDFLRYLCTQASELNDQVSV